MPDNVWNILRSPTGHLTCHKSPSQVTIRLIARLQSVAQTILHTTWKDGFINIIIFHVQSLPLWAHLFGVAERSGKGRRYPV